jgi:hypothetical protein
VGQKLIADDWRTHTSRDVAELDRRPATGDRRPATGEVIRTEAFHAAASFRLTPDA